MAQVIWTARSKQDILDIAEYVAADSPRSASRLVGRLFRIGGRLAKFPLSGRAIPQLRLRKYREVLEGSYRVIYRLEGARCYVVAVVHTKRMLTRRLVEKGESK